MKSIKRPRICICTVMMAAILFTIGTVQVHAGVIGTAGEVLDSKGSDIGETALGDLVSDAMRTAMGADAALVHAGALSGSLPKGEITDADVQAVVPLGDDKIVIVRLKADDIKALLERSVWLFPKANKGFLQVSGIELKFDATAAKFNRVVSWTIGGKEPKPDVMYTVAVPAFLAGGGVGYKEFSGVKIDDKNSLPLAEAVINYIKTVKNMEPKNEGRIKAIKIEGK